MIELRPVVISEMEAKFEYMQKLKDLNFTDLYDLETPFTESFCPNFKKVESKLA